MASRFEQQQPSRSSGVFNSAPRPQHVGRRLGDEEKASEKPTGSNPGETRNWQRGTTDR